MLILSLMLLLTTMIPINTALAESGGLMTAAAGTIYGDCNDDNVVDALDFAWFKQYLGNPNHEYNKYLDLNLDKSVDALDFAVMKQYLLKMIKTLPLDTQAPDAPTGLVCTSKTTNSVSLAWTASSDNAGVASYDILKNGALAGTSSLTNYTVTGLAANTIYSFTVKARDAAGNVSTASNALSVTTSSGNIKLIALSFDDGPSQTTSLVLDKLQKNSIPATFFLIGQNISSNTKPTMQRELDLGCEICNHSWTHSDMSRMSSSQISDEIKKTSDAIYNAVGVRPKFFRPPYISVSNTMYQAIDLPFINGINCTDWDNSVNAQTRASTIVNNAKDGDIVLLHDFSGNTQTVDALDSMIQGLKNKGFTFVTISQLFEMKGKNPNVEYKIWSNVLN
ncbi:MAG TPA: polysaccharide deacetylase family protein [Clostridia bacterium]|nr:polysaccharide deacetylase family protein [Clostridia bacterium]